ncbi:MAG: CrcB family protein [Myxococcota bacterium]|nr:CrcB family protein [Myxococcota bacterium]
MTWLLVMAGGAGGSALRYGLALLMNPAGGEGWPWGTLTANVVGCLLMGWLTSLLSSAVDVPEAVRVGVLVGVLGGFTTFSSFGLETFRFLQGGQLGLAAGYVALSNLAGIGGLWIGLKFSGHT